MGARAAHGEGAHLIAVNEGVVAVLPARCDVARSTHLPAGAARAVISTTSKLAGPDLTRSLTRGEGATSCEPDRCPTGRGQSCTSLLLGSRAHRVAESGGLESQSHGPPFIERGWRKSTLPGRLTIHNPVLVRCGSGCGMHCSPGPARRRRKNKRESHERDRERAWTKTARSPLAKFEGHR